MTQVTLGSFFTAGNGSNVIGGVGGSGIDTQAIIKALTDAKALPATNDQTQITANGKITTALNTFQTLLSTFKSAADALRNPPGVGNSADNVFAFTQSSETSNTAVAGSTYVTVTAAAGAALQSYSISSITSLATAASQTTGVITATSANDGSVTVSAADAGAGKFTEGVLNLNGQNITISAGDSLNVIAEKFNNASSQTGISATVVQVSGTQYELSFSATKTGSDQNFDLKSTTIDPSNTVFGNVSLADAVGGNNADFKINGISVERQTNNINDLVNGLTFNLLQETPALVPPDTVGTKINVAITPDTTTVQNTIIAFANSYNALKTFAAQQTQLGSDGTYMSTAILANNQTFRSIMSDVNSQVTAQVSGLATGNPSSLSDVGMTFVNQPASSTDPEVDNVLNIDPAKLTSALSTNYTGVKSLFGVHFSSNNENLTIFKDSNSIQTPNFTLNINPVVQHTETLSVVDANSVGVVADSGSPVDGEFTAGTITINGRTIELDTTDTLNTIAQKFNAVAIPDQQHAAGTGINASVVKIADGQYQLQFSLNSASRTSKFDLTDTTYDPSNTVLGNVHLSASQDPLFQAKYVFATQSTGGITATSEDASVVVSSDAPVAGRLTAGTVTINGQAVTLTAGDTLNNIVSKFNAVSSNTGIKASIVSVGTDPVTQQNQYQLVFTATTAGSDGIFDLTNTGVDPSNTVFGNVNLAATNTHNIDAAINLTVTSLGGGLPGYNLTGPSGSILDGLQMIYASYSQANNIQTSITQGIADKIYNTTNSATTTNTGSIAVALTGIQSANTKLNKDITNINTQVAQYTQQLLAKFGALEQAISQVNLLLDSLQAQSNAAISASGH